MKKSGNLKQSFHEFQKLEGLNKKNLEAGIDVRWNSLYVMLKSCHDNKKAIQLLCIEEDFESDCVLNGEEWKLIQEFVESLDGFYDVTMLLQRRDTSISYVIPIIKAVIHDLETKKALKFGNEVLIDGLLNSLYERFSASLAKK